MYLGNIPATSFETVQKDRFTGVTGTTVTLSHAVSSVNDILVFVNAVKQDYTNYSVNLTTLTLGGTLVASDIVEVCYVARTFQSVNPSAGSVGTSQLASNAVTSAKMFSGFKNGITMTDSWRITTTTNESTDADVTTNWEKNDTTGHTNIGTGLTESSGIFSFPQTGFYYIDYSFTIQTNTDSSAEITLKVTFNNSSYTNFSEAFCGSPTNASGAANQTCSNTNFINVTNISNVKFKFSTGSFGSGTKIIGNSIDEQRSGFSIIRLGDSQ